MPAPGLGCCVLRHPHGLKFHNSIPASAPSRARSCMRLRASVRAATRPRRSQACTVVRRQAPAQRLCQEQQQTRMDVKISAILVHTSLRNFPVQARLHACSTTQSLASKACLVQCCRWNCWQTLLGCPIFPLAIRCCFCVLARYRLMIQILHDRILPKTLGFVILWHLLGHAGFLQALLDLSVLLKPYELITAPKPAAAEATSRVPKNEK